VTANLSPDKRGLGGNVIFIDTENTFRAERIFQIAEHRAISEPHEILRKIFVCKIYNTSHLEVIIQDLGKSIEEYKAKLVIVDSIIALHRAEFIGRGTLADRQQRLNIMLHKLNRFIPIPTSVLIRIALVRMVGMVGMV
jgi:DNA repair protein RadA